MCRLVRIHKRLQKAVSCLEFFTTHEWNFKNTNVQKLFTELDPNDQKTFYFDVSQLEWRSYIESYIWGTRQFVLKDHPSTVPNAKLRLRRYVWNWFFVLSVPNLGLKNDILTTAYLKEKYQLLGVARCA